MFLAIFMGLVQKLAKKRTVLEPCFETMNEKVFLESLFSKQNLKTVFLVSSFSKKWLKVLFLVSLFRKHDLKKVFLVSRFPKLFNKTLVSLFRKQNNKHFSFFLEKWWFLFSVLVSKFDPIDSKQMFLSNLCNRTAFSKRQKSKKVLSRKLTCISAKIWRSNAEVCLKISV